jgi:hypothetical protein
LINAGCPAHLGKSNHFSFEFVVVALGGFFLKLLERYGSPGDKIHSRALDIDTLKQK